ncbi:unnamed protein product [Rotaria magnacalcarata]|uniref:CUB domain-containing protein n=1 Tax=Rotaria magnacalcarata TaxID=392030 RepID=A0A816WRX3_9BILA|nr:unnamed protein product [Rotaria magnacalcarata]CAF1985235.1 unnamed protein product [Rotaria magnacalcarata]CAF2137804.1 unnamed protein product [Rotaria magnacalcarata]
MKHINGSSLQPSIESFQYHISLTSTPKRFNKSNYSQPLSSTVSTSNNSLKKLDLSISAITLINKPTLNCKKPRQLHHRRKRRGPIHSSTVIKRIDLNDLLYSTRAYLSVLGDRHRMTATNFLRISTSFFLLILTIELNAAKVGNEKHYMDKMCGNDLFTLDGDKIPGISLQLTSGSKYKPNVNCTVKFRTAQPSQRLIVTMEKMDIADCPGDLLKIYDGKNLLNMDTKKQCGSPASFTVTSSTTQVSITFTSNAASESSGFQASIALHFPMIASCPQDLGVFQCKNKNCVSKQLECDGRNHCGDGTDENQCGILSG